MKSSSRMVVLFNKKSSTVPVPSFPDYYFPLTPVADFMAARSYNYGTLSDVLTTPSAAFPGAYGFIGGVLLTDGRVFCIPYS